MEIQLYKYYLDKYITEMRAITDPLERKITEKAISTINTPVYAVIAKINGASDEQVEQIYKAIKTQALHVLYLDKYFESGEEKYKELGDQANNQLDSLLPPHF